MRYLILFSTTDGHTKSVANAIAEIICTKDSTAHCTVKNIRVFMSDNTLTSEGVAEMKQYDKVVLGGSVRYGYFAQEVNQFATQYAPYLNSIPTGFFSVNMAARKVNKRTPETNPYTRRFLIAYPWKPTKAAVFAGALYYPRYSFFDRNVMRLIMKVTGGDTDPKTEKVYTDWNSVRAFAAELVEMTTNDIPASRENATEVEKTEVLQERTRRLYRLCFLGVVAGVAAITRVVTYTQLLQYD